MRFSANSSNMCCVDLSVPVTNADNIRLFNPVSSRRLCNTDEAYQGLTAARGCHCPDDMAVRMREVQTRPWVGVRECHLLLFLRC